MLNVTVSINILLEILANERSFKKKKTDRKEVKPCLFTDNIILKEVLENNKTLLKEIKSCRELLQSLIRQSS